ncbi:hypothetical protein B0H11DRAFT_1925464 [Mycena galericulata]|nr:hypothetical protein B0H11DRAFT_1925464 [Mycena galericulata]
MPKLGHNGCQGTAPESPRSVLVQCPGSLSLPFLGKTLSSIWTCRSRHVAPAVLPLAAFCRSDDLAPPSFRWNMIRPYAKYTTPWYLISVDMKFMTTPNPPRRTHSVSGGALVSCVAYSEIGAPTPECVHGMAAFSRRHAPADEAVRAGANLAVDAYRWGACSSSGTSTAARWAGRGTTQRRSRARRAWAGGHDLSHSTALGIWGARKCMHLNEVVLNAQGAPRGGGAGDLLSNLVTGTLPAQHGHVPRGNGGAAGHAAVRKIFGSHSEAKIQRAAPPAISGMGIFVRTHHGSQILCCTAGRQRVISMMESESKCSPRGANVAVVTWGGGVAQNAHCHLSHAGCLLLLMGISRDTVQDVCVALSGSTAVRELS